MTVVRVDWVNLILGLCTIAGFGLAMYEFLITRRRAIVEQAKLQTLIARIEHLKHSLAITHDTVDLAIQRIKSTSPSDIADTLRVARGTLLISLKELDDHKLTLRTWRFGRLLSSTPAADDLSTDKSPDDRS